MKNPWIYRQTREILAGREPSRPSIDERRALILEHFRLLTEQEEPKFALHKLRTFTGWYTHGLPGGKHLRARINSLHTADAFLEAIEEFFKRARVAA